MVRTGSHGYKAQAMRWAQASRPATILARNHAAAQLGRPCAFWAATMGNLCRQPQPEQQQQRATYRAYTATVCAICFTAADSIGVPCREFIRHQQTTAKAAFNELLWASVQANGQATFLWWPAFQHTGSSTYMLPLSVLQRHGSGLRWCIYMLPLVALTPQLPRTWQRDRRHLVGRPTRNSVQVSQQQSTSRHCNSTH